MPSTTPVGAHVHAIEELFEAAEEHDLPLWLESGWAIDARMGRVTRAHADVDIAFPDQRRDDYIDLLDRLRYGAHEFLEYGFLSLRGEVLLDSEPCFPAYDQGYGFPGFPSGSCPHAKEGSINGYAIRCLSWEAIFVELLEYADEVPRALWRAKDHVSWEIARAHVPQDVQERLERGYGVR
jgi:aminoglycoside 2''-adenylyltransferase